MKGNLKSLNGWMIYKKRSKGYTLIELIVAIAISMILSCVIITTIIDGVYDYKKYVGESRYFDSFDNAMLNLDNLCNSALILSFEGNNTQYLSSLGNNILITYLDDYESNNIKKKIVYFSDDKLRVKTISKDGSDITTGNNILLNEVKDFKVRTKGKLIYYEISTKWGGKRIRCI